ncbi:MAG: hypothetical protein Q7U99_06015 [Rubrivivax sp.]|nr:hypothetical protein [Rubrivivax sp.]MDP3223363.1 hypothetical protein [Rubrivivax sp.]
MIRHLRRFAVLWLLGWAVAVAAQDANITQPVADLERLLAAEPLVIESAQSSRPTAKGDITLRAEVSFGGAPAMRVKLRKAEPGADMFNNVPRYDLAAYELQKLFLDPAEYVVPPTALRFVVLADFTKHQADVARTFHSADQVLAVVQVWLSEIAAPADVYNAIRFDADPRYARHVGQMNILTHLIEHRDANLGNFLIGKAEVGARVFSIDHGVAFASIDSDRGDAWKDIRVKRLPADAVARLRDLTLPVLQQRLGVLAQWRLEGSRYVVAPLGPNLASHRGVRRSDKDLQMGLTTKEIASIDWLRTRLLKRIDAGEITLVPAAK